MSDVDPTRIGQCDFCAAGPGVHLWTYPCESFVISSIRAPDGEVQDQFSYGDWGACDPCSEIIERGDIDALVDRVIFEERVPAGDMRMLFRMQLGSMYRQFFAKRSGARREDRPEETPGRIQGIADSMESRREGQEWIRRHVHGKKFGG